MSKKYIPLAEAKQLFEDLVGLKSWLHYRQIAAQNGFKWNPADVKLEGMSRFYSTASIKRFARFLVDNDLIG